MCNLEVDGVEYTLNIIEIGGGPAGKSFWTKVEFRPSRPFLFSPLSITVLSRIPQICPVLILLLYLMHYAFFILPTVSFWQSFSWADGFMLVFSLTDSDSFDGLQEIRREILQTKKVHSFPFCLVGTHLDLANTERQILSTEGRSLAHDWGGVPFVELSAKTGKNVVKAFELMVTEIRDFDKNKELSHPVFVRLQREQKWKDYLKKKREKEWEAEDGDAGDDGAESGEHSKRDREDDVPVIGKNRRVENLATEDTRSEKKRKSVDIQEDVTDSENDEEENAKTKLVEHCEGYVIEGGQFKKHTEIRQNKARRLVGAKNAGWYREYFYDHKHKNFVGFDPKLGPIIISVLKEQLNTKEYNVRIISRTQYVCAIPLQHSCFIQLSVDLCWILIFRLQGVKSRIFTKEELSSSKLNYDKRAIQLVEENIAPDSLKLVSDSKLKDDLLKFEDETVTHAPLLVLYKMLTFALRAESSAI